MDTGTDRLQSMSDHEFKSFRRTRREKFMRFLSDSLYTLGYAVIVCLTVTTLVAIGRLTINFIISTL